MAPTTAASPAPPTGLPPEEADVLAAMRRRHPDADPVGLVGLPPSAVPRHIAVIMDGNGRWAAARSKPRMWGHRAGADRVEEVVRAASRLGVEAVTVYSFSSENWRRPAEEIDALMELCVEYCSDASGWIAEENARVRVIGRREGMPAPALAALDAMREATAGCTGVTLSIAVNYGSRAEIADAARELARDAAAGRLDPDAIDDDALASRLGNAGLPEVDLLIRTGGEQRLSNFLLWQLSYAELVFVDTAWPDFGRDALHDAVRTFAGRKRRFGAVDGAASDEADT